MADHRARIFMALGLAWLTLSGAGAVGVAGAQGDTRGQVGSSGREFVLDELSGASVPFPDRTEIGIPLTVVVFWSTWSEPSKRELKRLSELWPVWSTHGVRVVAVNVEAHEIGVPETQRVRAHLVQNPLPFPVVMDRRLAAFHAYGVVAVPTTLVIDSAGTIVLRLPGYPVGGAERLVEYVERAVINSGLEARGEVPQRSHEHRRALRHTRLGRLLAAKGELELAEYTLKQALGQNPALLDARLALAELYETSAREDQAQQVLQEASLAFPDDSRLLLAYASHKLRAGDLIGSEELARRAFGLNPSLSSALLVLARVRIASNNVEGALEFLTEAAAANPLDLDVMIELGRVHESMGAKTRAVEWYERAYSLLDPTWHP